MQLTGTPQELASLYRRMAEAMAQLKRLPKRGRNERFSYDYVTDSDVLDAVRGVLGGAGVAFFTHVVDVDRSRTITTRSGDMVITELTVDAMFADSETGATVTVTWTGEAMDGQDKGANKALTAAVKYGLLKTLLISTGEDDPDGEVAAEEQPKVKAAAPKKQEPAAAPKANGDGKHWIENDKVRARFWAWTKNDLALTESEVHQALNVTSVKDFGGTMDQAKLLIEAWADSASEEVAGE